MTRRNNTTGRVPDSSQLSILRLANCGSRSAHAANPSGGKTLFLNTRDCTLLGSLGHSAHFIISNVTVVAFGIIRCGTIDDLHSNAPWRESESNKMLVLDASITQTLLTSWSFPENNVFAILNVVRILRFESPEGSKPDN